MRQADLAETRDGGHVMTRLLRYLAAFLLATLIGPWAPVSALAAPTAHAQAAHTYDDGPWVAAAPGCDHVSRGPPAAANSAASKPAAGPWLLGGSARLGARVSPTAIT